MIFHLMGKQSIDYVAVCMELPCPSELSCPLFALAVGGWAGGTLLGKKVCDRFCQGWCSATQRRGGRLTNRHVLPTAVPAFTGDHVESSSEGLAGRLALVLGQAPQLLDSTNKGIDLQVWQNR